MDPKIIINSIKAGIFLLLLTPFVKLMDYYFPFVGPKGIYFMAVSELVFFLWVILAWRWKQYRPDLNNPLIAAIFVFVGASFASAVFGADFSASFWSKFERMGGILILLHLAALAIVMPLVLKGRDWVLLFSASIGLAAIIGIQALFDKSAAAHSGGLIGNDSFWGTYILFNIFIALYLFLSQNRPEEKRIKNFSGIMFIILTACLMTEGTIFWQGLIYGNASELPHKNFIRDVFEGGARAVKIAFFVGTGLLGILWMATRKNKLVKIFATGSLCVLTLLTLFIVYFGIQKGNAVYQLMVNDFSEGSVRGRLVVWETAWKGFLERPLLGWGPENFNLVFARYYNPCLGSPECSGETWFDRAHNIVMDTLVETGVIGLVSYLAIFAAAIYLLWRAYFLKTASFALAGTFTALLAAYFLQNLTVFDMITSYSMLFICLAFIASLYKPSGADEKVWPMPLDLWRVLLPAAAAMVCLWFFVVNPLSVDRNVVVAASGYAGIDAPPLPFGSPQRLELYRNALGSPMGKYQIRMFFASQWMMVIQNKDIVAGMTEGQANGMYSFLADELKKSCRESPLDYQAHLYLGQIYNGWSLLDGTKSVLAEDILKKAIDISPDNQQGYWELAQTYLYQARIDDAEAAARKAYDLYPRNSQAKKTLDGIEKLKNTPETKK